MDLYSKISILGPSAQYDICGPQDFGQTTSIPGVYHAKVAGNHICRLFKVLQTNYCLNNCRYCAYRRSRNCSRATATPEQMAQAFALAHSRRLVDGLFLSSALISTPDSTMTPMLDTLDILRNKFKYRGYIHLKIMPGASDSCIRQSLKLANRISLNIESATQESLSTLSPNKDLKKGFFATLFAIKKAMSQAKYFGRPLPSLTTQFVVGASSETDKQIINTAHLLYQQFGLKRIFYSPFRPVAQTPFAHLPPAPLSRAHRLYQADFLLRFYGFSPQDFSLTNDSLPANIDPKTFWAQNHPQYFPINLNRASYFHLLRIPGIGPVSAKKIISLRRAHRLYSFHQLSSLRLQLTKIHPYVTF